MNTKNEKVKECYCETCQKAFHSLGIMRHRAMHRDKREDCVIEFSNGERVRYNFSSKK